MKRYWIHHDVIRQRRKELWKQNREARCEELRRRYLAKQTAAGLAVKKVRRPGETTPEIITAQRKAIDERFRNKHRERRNVYVRKWRRKRDAMLMVSDPVAYAAMISRRAAYHHMYRKREKEKRRKWGVAYAERHKDDLNYVMSRRLRARIRMAIVNGGGEKSPRSMELLGCSVQEAAKHLESKFTKGMTWDKFLAGEIHIDHIRPCASFDLSHEDEQRRCFHWSNLQPLWKPDNLSKGYKLPCET